MTQVILALEGIYFVLTGLWPLLHLSSFLKVTGPKTDTWLVKIFGVVITSIGASLLLSFLSSDQSGSIVFLGLTSALVVALANIYFVYRRSISPVYLVDAAVELVIVSALTVALARA